MKSTNVLAEELLNDVLCDMWIEEVRLSDTWFAGFSNDLWLSAYEIELSSEPSLSALLASSAPTLLTGVDADNVAKMTCLCALMREKISGCDVKEGGSLRITFEHGAELRAMTSVPIVDWMWAVGSEPGDPYQVPSIAYCLSAGQVEVGTLNRPGRRSRLT